MSKIFEQFPDTDDILCPVCNTNKEGRCILIPIVGTSDGNLCEAQPFHLDCVLDELVYSKEKGLVLFKI